MNNRVMLHEWSNKERSGERHISMFDTMLSSTLTECQVGPTHNLSLALNDHVQVLGIVSGMDAKKGKAEVTPHDLAKKGNISLETAKKTLLRMT